jgi:hypothetical protein
MKSNNRGNAMFGFPKDGWTLTIVVLAAAALLLTFSSERVATAKSHPQVNKPVVVSSLEVWQADLKAFEERWNALIAQRSKVDTAKWNALEADIRELAKKHGLATEDHTLKASANAAMSRGGGGSGFSACPPRDDIPGYRCYLFPGPKGVCRYVCTPIKK